MLGPGGKAPQQAAGWPSGPVWLFLSRLCLWFCFLALGGARVCPVSFRVLCPPLSPGPGLSTRLGCGHRSEPTPPQSSSCAMQTSPPGKGDAGSWQESISSSFLQRSWPSGVAGSPPLLPFRVVLTGHEAPPCPRVGEPHKRSSQHIRAGIVTHQDPGPGNRALTGRWLPGLYSQQDCRRT